jgi:transposase
VLNGVFWVLRSGAPARDLPVCYGPPATTVSSGNGNALGSETCQSPGAGQAFNAQAQAIYNARCMGDQGKTNSPFQCQWRRPQAIEVSSNHFIDAPLSF